MLEISKVLEKEILPSQQDRLLGFLNVQFLKTAHNSVWLSNLNVNGFDGTASNLYLRPITSSSKQSSWNIICSGEIFAIQCSSEMAVNSPHFACCCFNQQTVNHPSVSRLTDVWENHRGQFSFSPHSVPQTISVPVYSHGFVFPHPHTEISPKCPKEKKKPKPHRVHFTRKVISSYCIWIKTCLYFELVCSIHCSRAGITEEQNRKAKGLVPSPCPAGARHSINSIPGTLLPTCLPYSVC